MKKFLSLLVIAASMLLCGCSKESETDPEATENVGAAFFVQCDVCGQKYYYTPYEDGLYHFYADIDGEWKEFKTAGSGVVQWNCCGKIDEDTECDETVSAGPLPAIRIHILL